VSLVRIACKFLVRKGGLEPPWISPPDPKSGASANFATFAFKARAGALLKFTACALLGRGYGLAGFRGVEVEGAHAALAGGVVGDVEGVAEGLGVVAVDGFFECGVLDFADGRVEEAGADGAVQLDYG
jgi:hypothetical protein